MADATTVVCRVAFTCCVAAASALHAQRPLNLDFELASVAARDKPWGWSHGWSPFASGPAASFTLDSTARRSGQRSLRIALGDSGSRTPQTIMLQLPAAFAAGRSVRLAGWMRGEQLRGRAFFTLEAWGDGQVVAADTSVLGAPNGSWSRHEAAIPATTGAHSIVVTVALEGPGSAWFDAFEMLLDGSPVTQLATGSAAPTDAIAWFAAHSQPLRDVRPPSTAASADDADLAQFDKIVGSARVVALGESTHGTREFFLAKHRLFEHLVRRLGFSVFAIEANQIAVETVNRYVSGGAGTARDAMRVMFRVWNTEEVRDLVEWMRAYNAATPSRPLRFIGYDMQDHVRPIDSLRAFLTRKRSGLATLLPPLDAYRAQRSWSTPQVPDTMRRTWRIAAEEISTAVGAQRPAWLAAATTARDSLEVEWAVQAGNLIRQAALGNETLNVPDRDSLMAANLDWALRTLVPGERAVVWAHDIHVSRGGDPHLSFYKGATMGAQLSRIFGADYRTFSLLTYEGSYSATKSLTNHEMTVAAALPAPIGSLEHALHQVARPAASVGLTVDLRAARNDASARWLQQPRRLRHVGYAAYDFAFDLAAVFPLEFDGVVFIDRTNASRLLP